VTNKIVLKEIDQFMADYTPIYQAVYPLFLSKKATSYTEKAGQVTLKRLEAVGDIRNRHVTPKDTEIKQIAVKQGEKTFKKYFLGSQYVESDLQEHENVDDIVTQVLDEHQKAQDDLLLLGEGTSASTMINNGLFWSNDSNYILQSSSELASTGGHLPALHTSVVTQAITANQVAGEKVVMFYGSTMIGKVNSLYSDTQNAFKDVLQKVLTNFRIMELPAAITTNGANSSITSANGFIIVNLDQVKLHYCALPKLAKQGVNDEESYVWWNFLQGSMMLEVLAYGGVIRQPHTFA
jgi:hypothetical protein